MLKVDQLNIQLNIPLGDRNLIKDFSIEVPLGEWICLFGPNGAGKSTLLKSLAGLGPAVDQKLIRERISYCHCPIENYSPQNLVQWVTYVPQDLEVHFPMTVLEAVLLGQVRSTNLLGQYAVDIKKRAFELLEDWNISSWIKRDIRTLSSGERQKVNLLRALFQGSKYLLLDESLSRLDIDQQLGAIQKLKKYISEGRSIILVSHDINLCTEATDRFLLLNSKGYQTLHLNTSESVEILKEWLRNSFPLARVEQTQSINGRFKFLFHREVKFE